MTALTERSRQDFFIYLVVYKFTFKNNLIMLLSRFTFILTTGKGPPKPGIIYGQFYSHAYVNTRETTRKQT